MFKSTEFDLDHLLDKGFTPSQAIEYFGLKQEENKLDRIIHGQLAKDLILQEQYIHNANYYRNLLASHIEPRTVAETFRFLLDRKRNRCQLENEEDDRVLKRQKTNPISEKDPKSVPKSNQYETPKAGSNCSSNLSEDYASYPEEFNNRDFHKDSSDDLPFSYESIESKKAPCTEYEKSRSSIQSEPQNSFQTQQIDLLEESTNQRNLRRKKRKLWIKEAKFKLKARELEIRNQHEQLRHDIHASKRLLINKSKGHLDKMKNIEPTHVRFDEIGQVSTSNNTLQPELLEKKEGLDDFNNHQYDTSTCFTENLEPVNQKSPPRYFLTAVELGDIQNEADEWWLNRCEPFPMPIQSTDYQTKKYFNQNKSPSNRKKYQQESRIIEDNTIDKNLDERNKDTRSSVSFSEQHSLSDIDGLNLDQTISIPIGEAWPDPGDKITYKILEMSMNYTPEISDFKQATVLFTDFTNGSITLESNLSNEQYHHNYLNHSDRQLGKFELPPDEEEHDQGIGKEYPSNQNNITTVEYSSLLDVHRLVASP